MAYAIGDVLSLRHSLHRKPADAKAFYGTYFGLVLLAAILVINPGTPLGLLTNAVQTLAGVLLPSATVFLLLLCNNAHAGRLTQTAFQSFNSRRLRCDGSALTGEEWSRCVTPFPAARQFRSRPRDCRRCSRSINGATGLCSAKSGIV